MNIKGIAFDIDGTLIPRGCNNVSDKTKEILKVMKNKKYPLVIITSRSHQEMKSLDKTFLELFDYAVLSTGTLIFKNWCLIRKNTIHREMFSTFIDTLEKNNIMYGYSRNDFEFIYSQTASTELQGRYSSLFMGDYKVRKLELKDEVIDFIYLLEKNQLINLKKYVTEQIELCDFKIHGQVKPAGINKGYGLREVAKELKMKASDFLVFGDGINDIPMFREAGISVAMGNASDEVKNQANFTCGIDKEDGVAQFIEKWITNEFG